MCKEVKIPAIPEPIIRELIQRKGAWLYSSWCEDRLVIDGEPARSYCTECDEHVADMTPDHLDLHIIRRGQVLIGCEGYWTPLFLAAVARWEYGPDAVVLFDAEEQEFIDAVYGDITL